MNPERWQKIRRICEDALECDSGDREDFLVTACAGDIELRKDVDSFLACGHGKDGFIEAPAMEIAAQIMANEEASNGTPDLTGQAFLHYCVAERIGAGGMGEVYRAHDERLKRDVAIKVLPDIFTGDPERLARFDREARLLASMNHPNIAAIYGLEEYSGKRFLVLELVEGPTLVERLKKGPLPLQEALQVCRQIAEGLEAAHEKGIIHRDLKPANVKVASDGRVKLLDFGLARAVRTQGATSDLLNSPTITQKMTRPGVILGTAAYMSPEQARGEEPDRRTDIWGFGCLLYECLTGRAPFQGQTVTDLMAKILECTPDWGLLPAATPKEIKKLLLRCLRKDPRERLHDIADARIEISEALSSRPVPEPTPIPRPVRSWLKATLFAGPVVTAIAAALITWHFRPAAVLPVVRFPLKIESGMCLGELHPETGVGYRPVRTPMAIASNGRFLVYSAVPEDGDPPQKSQIYLRIMDQAAATPIAGTEGGANPFLSPDDQWLGFWAGGKLRKVRVAGGTSTVLCDAAESPYGSEWGPDNTIVFSPAFNVGLSRVSADGGKPEVLTVPEKSNQEDSHRLPHILPLNRGVLFTIMDDAWTVEPHLAVLDLQTRKWRDLIENAADGRYLPTGHVVFMRQGTLMAVPFDIDRMKTMGQPQPVVAKVMQAIKFLHAAANSAAGQYCISGSGWLAYVPGGIAPEVLRSLVHLDMKGNALPVADFTTGFFAPRFSPDGKRISYRNTSDNKLWVYDLDRGTASLVTTEGRVGYPIWTPPGDRLVFLSKPGDLYWQAWDRSSNAERLTQNLNSPCPGSFTPDGGTLAFAEMNPETNWDILLMDMKSRKIRPFLNTKAEEGWPDFSPKGHWLAYASSESGHLEVWVRPFPGPGGQIQISSNGGDEPIWSKDGRQLYYRKGDQVWVAEIMKEGSFSPGKPRLLFTRRLHGTSPVRGWDLWPDGRGFLGVEVVQNNQQQPVTDMVLVQNWFEELKRLMPSANK